MGRIGKRKVQSEGDVGAGAAFLLGGVCDKISPDKKATASSAAQPPATNLSLA